MGDVLTNIRLLLLSFATVTDLVDQRIRPHKADSSDGNADLIILESPDADQDNLFSGESIIRCDLVVRSRSTDKVRAFDISEAVHDELNDYAGTAGNGTIIQCERLEFSQYEIEDEDDDNDTLYETESTYLIFYQT